MRFPYPQQRVLEDAAFTRRTTPTRFFTLLLPVWCVTIQATVTSAEDYDLIDRFLERGIVEGGLTTTGELARFFALDEVLVDRALRSLVAIGHVTSSAGGWTLTSLGLRSTQDQKRYVIKAEDRRKLYFDGWGSRPLTRPYYDSRKVTMLTLEAAPSGFQALHTTRGFDFAALTGLASHPHRDRFNLPERIDDPRPVAVPEQVFLPLYVVRAVDSRGRIRYMAYSQASDEADPDTTELLEQTPEIAGVLETEDRAANGSALESRAREWLSKNNLDGRSARLGNGVLRVTLPRSAFTGSDAQPLYRLGSFVLQGNGFFQLWCADEKVRVRALLDRVERYLTSRSRVDVGHFEGQVARIARQLEFGAITLAELARMAGAEGKKGLAAQLNRLVSR